MTERKLASIQTVSAVTPIENADAIETLTIGGWKVVSQKGNFKPGDKCVYFEIDSFLPLDNPVFEFLAARGEKTIDGVRGHVLRTAKLRGQYSQGLALPFNAFEGTELSQLRDFYFPGDDVTSLLGVTKYEPPIPANLSGEVVGSFPTQFAPKTDAERVQNLSDEYDKLLKYTWYATEKVDGTSVTYINDGGTLRVCSRNLELKNNGQTQWKLAEQLDVFPAMKYHGLVIQGEVYGEGIQGNPLGVKGHHLAVFSVLVNRAPIARQDWPAELQKIAVPIYKGLELPNTIDGAVEQADGIKSLIAPSRKAEGIVWHNNDGMTFTALDGRACFKAISNAYLLKQKD